MFVSGLQAFAKTPPATRVLRLCAVIHLLFLILFRYAYPSPMTTADTGNYILVAITGEFGGFRPEGYSWFLSFFRSLTNAFTGIAWWQFIFHAVSSSIFLLCVSYVSGWSRKTMTWVTVLVLCSPFTYYLTHWAMSDSVFISLTFIYLSTFILLFHRFSTTTFLVHLVAMWLAMQTRQAALFYPILTAGAIWICFGKKYWWQGLLPLLLIWITYQGYVNDNKQLYGTETFSGFGGWARANNAAAVIPYVDKDHVPLDERLRVVHGIVTSFPDSVFSTDYILYTSFMWRREFPGKAVMFAVGSSRPFDSYAHAWVYSGKLLGDYGTWLIKTYPGKFLLHFVWPNIRQIFWPMVTVGPYELKEPDEQMRNWYEGAFPTKQVRVDFMKELPVLLKIHNLLLWLAGIGGFFALLYKRKKGAQGPWLVIGFFVILFAGFSVIAHPIHLRYLLPVYPALVLLAAAGWHSLRSMTPASSA